MELKTLTLNGTTYDSFHVTDEQIASAVEDYMAEHPIEVPDSSPNVNPVPKTDDMTQPVGVDADGRLWVAPIGGSGGDTPVVPITHGIVWDLVNVTSSNPVASVSDGASLSAVLTPADGYTLGDVIATMGGEALTGVWNADTATVTIANVTGDVIISCAGVEQTGPVDTTAVIAQENVGIDSSGATIDNQYTTPLSGICITKVYEYSYDNEALKASSKYDATNDYLNTNGIQGGFKVLTPATKHKENGGYATSIAQFTKIRITADSTPVTAMSNSSVSGTEYGASIPRYHSELINANSIGFEFTVTSADIDDSYAYWYAPQSATVFPVGVRAGDIIFAGKNTPYYGMANIDGTMAGDGASTASELSYDDDVSQNYAVATASILGEDTVTDTNTAYGISAEFAAVIDEVRTAWMLEYGGDYRKIPLIITTDQHGRTNAGIFNMLGKTLSMHDVSKICNLGDTVATEWYDEDTTYPLVSCALLENWCKSIKAIPFSKRLDVYGNHDTWYGNYDDEGNAIGTRYPANQSHLDQYFRNIYARRNNNNGWFAIRDDYFNVKYVVISGFEYDGGSTFRIGTKQMRFIIDEFGKDDGYDIVVVSHVPLYYQVSTNNYPTGMTPDDVSDATIMRVSAIDTDALFTARKNKTSGTVTDSDGVEHSFDFSGCTTDILCSLHGHTHDDAYNYTGGNGLLSEAFDWFDNSTIHFVLVDRINRQLNVWKVEGDALTYTNYQVPFDKVVE